MSQMAWSDPGSSSKLGLHHMMHMRFVLHQWTAACAWALLACCNHTASVVEEVARPWVLSLRPLWFRNVDLPLRAWDRGSSLMVVQRSLSAFTSCRSLSSLVAEDSIARELVTIFTKHSQAESDKLDFLASKLTPRIVETALSGFTNWRNAHKFFRWAANQERYVHNIYTYNAMAGILSHAGQDTATATLVNDVLTLRCPMSPRCLGFLIRCLGRVRLAEDANALFDQAKRMGLCLPDNYTYNCLLEALSKSGSIDLVERRMKEMLDLGWELDRYTLTPILQAYCNSGMIDKALGIFGKISDSGWVDEHTFTILVMAFSKRGEVDMACDLIRTMDTRNLKLTEKSYCNLINGFVNNSRIDSAVYMFERMKKSGFVPDRALYCVLIRAYCMNKELCKALDLYSEMKKAQLRPNSAIVSALVHSVHGEEELAQLFDHIHADLNENTLTLFYNRILELRVNSGSLTKAYSLIKAMIGIGFNDEDDGFDADDKFIKNRETGVPNSTSFEIVINGLIKECKLDLSLALFRDMARIGVKPDLQLYNTMIRGLCSSNRLEESFHLLKEMEESGVEPDQMTHNCLFGCICGRKDTHGTLDLLKRMRVFGHEPWIKHSTSLVKELCKENRVTEALNFLDQMFSIGFRPDIVAFSASLNGLVKTGEINRALELFRDMGTHGYFPDVVVCNILIKGFCKEGRMEVAESVVGEMVTRGLSPSHVTCNLLIDGWCKGGFIDKAMTCFSNMFTSGREPNVVTYTTLIDGLCTAGRPDDALALWDRMKREKCTPNRVAFMALIHGICRCDRPGDAILRLREMEANGMEPDAYVYISLLNAYLANLNFSAALEVLQEMAYKQNLPGSNEKSFASLRDAIDKLCDDGKSKDVNNLFTSGLLPSALRD